ncbi:MAG: hypothetical protein WBF90_36990 [Rivularia sp. (in: cyanobacteria)]
MAAKCQFTGNGQQRNVLLQIEIKIKKDVAMQRLYTINMYHHQGEIL